MSYGVKRRVEVWKDGKLVEIYNTLSEAAKKHGVDYQNVWKICNGYKSKLNGFDFRYVDED